MNADILDLLSDQAKLPDDKSLFQKFVKIRVD